MVLSALGGRSLLGKTFQPSFWDLGAFGVMMATVTFIWNGFAFAVLCAPQYSNSAIDQDPGLFNYAIVIMAGVTVIALEEWWRKSNGDWFHNLKDLSTTTDSQIETHDGGSGGPPASSPAIGVKTGHTTALNGDTNGTA